jgi:hypothetical protein
MFGKNSRYRLLDDPLPLPTLTKQVLQQKAAAAADLAAASYHGSKADRTALSAAVQAAAAAEARARAAADLAQALERRLERARQGGRKALQAAAVLQNEGALG